MKLRLDFPIPLFEPTTPILLERINKVDDFLFPTNFNIEAESTGGVALHVERMEIDKRAWISQTRAYQIICSIGERLGLDIWVHWFRSQRASQLSEEYGFDVERLNRFFGWTGGPLGKETTSQKYAKLSIESMWERMRPEKIRVW